MAFGEVGRIVDHRDDERLAGGRFEGADDALRQLQQQDLPDGDDAGERQHREHRRLDERQHLGPQQDALPAPAIHEDAGDRPEKQHGDLRAEAHQPEQECRIGEPVDQPARRQPRDPRPDERDALTGEKQPVVPVAK